MSKKNLSYIAAILFALAGVVTLIRTDNLVGGLLYFAAAVVNFYIGRKKDGDSGPPSA
jgi:hypothetical protein